MLEAVGQPSAKPAPSPALPAEALADVPPALAHELRAAFGRLADGGAAGLARVVAEGVGWLGAAPALAAVAAWLSEARQPVELRCCGCAWLALYPTVDTVARLAAIATDRATPAPVRDEAIRGLGGRQLRDRHPATQWPADALALADEALIKLADAAVSDGKLGSDALPRALRHVHAEALASPIARAPGLWGDAIECFATPPLARVLAVSLDEIPPQHRLRVLRLVGATLGEEAVPVLLARAGGGPPRAADLAGAAGEERRELIFLAIASGGERHAALLEDAIAGAAHEPFLRARARWHLAHPGVVPSVRGLRVARTTAVIAPAERAARCAEAADDLRALAGFGRYAEAEIYDLWGWLVRGAGDPARARELVAAHPESQRRVRELYLEDLARRGRVRQLATAAHQLGAVDAGALALAIWGRPLAALELATTAPHHTAALACARALACYRAGRPDLTARLLAEDLPPAAPTSDGGLAAFPGPDERWRIERAPDAHPELVALAGGAGAVVELGRPAPIEAEPDAATLEPVAAVARRLARSLRGATVYLGAELEGRRRDEVAAAVVAAGGHVAAGPVPGTDFYVVGDACPVHTIARLERQGARRLRPDELGSR
jgi:hypothetical protein